MFGKNWAVYASMFCLGVACDILWLYMRPSAPVVDDIEVLLFLERVTDADAFLNDHVVTEDAVTGDLAEMVRYTRRCQVFWRALLIELNFSLAMLFAFVETCLGLQASEVLVNASTDWGLVCLWLQFIGIATYTIWARGVGPRFRPDQMSDLTWKDLLFFLVGLLVLIIITFYAVKCVVTSLDSCASCSDAAFLSSARMQLSKIKLLSCMLTVVVCGPCWRWLAWKCFFSAATSWT